MNTGWYIKQLKNTTPYGSKKIAISLSDRELDRIGPAKWEPRTIHLEVPQSVFAKAGITDTAITNKGSISWVMKNPTSFGKIKVARAQDIIALDIVQSAKWKRPIYWSVTCSKNTQIGLGDYLEMEGMAYRLVPKKNSERGEYINRELMEKYLLTEPKGYSKTYQPGFKFRSLNDTTVFLDENHRRLANNYRNPFLLLVFNYLENGMNNKAVKVLDMMEKKLPHKIIPIEPGMLYNIATWYKTAGANKQAEKITNELEPVLLAQLKKNPTNFRSQNNPYIILRDIYESRKEYDKLVELFTQLKDLVPNDPTLNNLIESYKKKAKAKLITK